MNYTETIEALAVLGPELPPAVGAARRRFSLDGIRTLMAELGNPQNSFPSVLIAGTNGKGSTAATLASIANAAGLRTGLYTSPHLLRVNERIRLSRDTTLAEVDDATFAQTYTRVDAAAHALMERGALEAPPSFFERITAMAFCIFAEQQVDVAILEVGLGGRLDATNIVEPLVSVITDIALDHMAYLGDTIDLIAREKAGILRRNGVLVTLAQHPLANAAIGETAVELSVRGVDAARFLPPRGFLAQPDATSPLGRNRYDVPLDADILHLDSPLHGQHQQRNLALAVAAAVELRENHGFDALTNDAIERGVSATEWPGRLEFLPGAGAHAPLLLDVAHNPAGAWTLRSALAELPEDRPRTLIFSCLRDKPIAELAQVLFPLFDSHSGDPLRARDHIVLAPIQNARAASVAELLEAASALDIEAHAAPHLPAALEQARELTPPEGIIVATGSVFLVGELRALALGS